MIGFSNDKNVLLYKLKKIVMIHQKKIRTEKKSLITS